MHIGGQRCDSPVKGHSMKMAQIIEFEGEQAVKLPREFRLTGEVVSIRRQGRAIILEPLQPANWPEGFFEEIRIDDPAFSRPPQGAMPAVPSLSCSCENGLV
jgi:antitoxin VapB